MEFNWASSKKTQGDNRGYVQYQYQSSFTC